MPAGGRKHDQHDKPAGPAAPAPPPPPPPAPRAAPYLDPYRDAVDRFGPRFEATLWASPEHQRLRFQVLTECLDFSGAVVVDAGSGDGEFARYLAERAVTPRLFVGLEALPEMAVAAAQRTPAAARAEFHHCDFLQDDAAFTRFTPAHAAPDAIIFCGSLNTLSERQALHALERAWAAAGRALLFNFLTDQTCSRTSRRDTGPARRFRTLRMVEWALSRTTSVVLRHDYLPGHDATVCMQRVG